MPVLYEGLIPEHNATRQAAGLFDVSHMGEIRVRGPEALEALNYLSTNDVSAIADGQAQYGAILNDKGGVVDDIIIYRFSQDNFLICVNASNADLDFEWLKSRNKHQAEFTNESAEWSQIAIQGPKAVEIAEKFFGIQLSDLKYFRFRSQAYNGSELILARTGYTGEDGLEIFMPNSLAQDLWFGLLEEGQAQGLKPCGLGARDTLRLEAALPLHGHELSPDITAIESGISRFISFNKGDFIGRQALIDKQAADESYKLIGFELNESGIARAGDKLFNGDTEIGYVTSGTKTPTVNKAIGLALVKTGKDFEPAAGTKILAEIRGKKINSAIISIPFYKKPKVNSKT